MERRSTFDALVLAGGRAERLDGADKAALDMAGKPLLDRLLNAVANAERVIVVGPRRRTARAVDWRRERPPGGGPVAALAEGLDDVRAPVVVVLAADLPFVTDATIDRLIGALMENRTDGAIARDASGRDQPLLGAYRTAALRSAVATVRRPHGVAMGEVLTGLKLTHSSEPRDARDCDTWADVEAARAELSGR